MWMSLSFGFFNVLLNVFDGVYSVCLIFFGVLFIKLLMLCDKLIVINVLLLVGCFVIGII